MIDHIVEEFIADFNDIAAVIVKHNKTIKHTLSLSMGIMIPFLTMQFAMVSMDYEITLKIMVFSLSILNILPMMYLLSKAGQVATRSHCTLNEFHSIQVNKSLSLKTKHHLLTLIRHMNQKAEAIGFTIGDFMIFTRLTLINLIFTSASLTFLVLTQFA